MNILHLTPYYAPAYAFGGVTRAVEGMARALADRGHTVTVLTTDALSPTERCSGSPDELRDGVRVVRARNLWPRGRLNLSSPLTMERLATDLLAEAEVLHLHEFRTVENLLVTPMAARRGLPMVLSPHGTLTLTTGRGGLKAAWDRLLSPLVARRIAAVIGLTALGSRGSAIRLGQLRRDGAVRGGAQRRGRRRVRPAFGARVVPRALWSG